MNGSQIPAAWVSAGYGVPDVCARHGEPAVEHRKVTLTSRPPGWSYALVLGGLLLFVIVASVLRKSVVAPRWPFCPRCQEFRSRRIKTGLGLLAGAVVAVIASFAIAAATSNADTGALVLVIGNLLFIAGLVAGVVALAQSGWRSITAAVVSADGNWVTVSSPSLVFTDRVVAAARLSRTGQ